jgi:ACR3 family arsenite efflux pump ArsB
VNEEQGNQAGVFKRAAIGLAIVALTWTVVLLFASKSEDEMIDWLIPIAAAALSVICFSIHTKSGAKSETQERLRNKREDTREE